MPRPSVERRPDGRWVPVGGWAAQPLTHPLVTHSRAELREGLRLAAAGATDAERFTAVHDELQLAGFVRCAPAELTPAGEAFLRHAA